MTSREPYPLLDRPWRRLRNYLRLHLMWRRITTWDPQSLKTPWAWGESNTLCIREVCVCVHHFIFVVGDARARAQRHHALLNPILTSLSLSHFLFFDICLFLCHLSLFPSLPSLLCLPLFPLIHFATVHVSMSALTTSSSLRIISLLSLFFPLSSSQLPPYILGTLRELDEKRMEKTKDDWK